MVVTVVNDIGSYTFIFMEKYTYVIFLKYVNFLTFLCDQ